MTEIKFTPVEEIPKIHAGLYKTFKAGVCRPLAYRRTQLHGLARMLQENADALADALYADLGKPRTEVFAFELHLLIDRATVTAQKLEEWAAPEHPECFGEPQKSWGLAVHKTPKGPVLMIAPWNYPYFLCLVTIIAAIAAGVPAALKPSEIAPASAQILADLFPKYIDPDAYVVVNGAVEETSKLLELKWAHISYTGGGRVGRVVAAAAAKHLTPITLELGGKSPVLIDPSYDIDLAAKRILFGKATNAGQTCVAPDYVLVTRDQQTALIEALQKHYSTCFPGTGGALASSSYGRIVSPSHFARLRDLLSRTRGRIVVGGDSDETALKLAPTVVADVELNDALMSEEIFGPILPIVPVSDVNEAIDVVNSLDQPLTLYVFTESPELKKKIKDETISGSLIFNDTLMQVALGEIPFGGVGESGYGYQLLKWGFDGYTHMRGIMDMPKEAEPFLSIRYPPHTEENTKLLGSNCFKPVEKFD